MPFRSIPNGRAFVLSQAATAKDVVVCSELGADGAVGPKSPRSLRGFERYRLIVSVDFQIARDRLSGQARDTVLTRFDSGNRSISLHEARGWSETCGTVSPGRDFQASC